MILVPIESLKDGMVLGKDILDEKGELLVAAGVEIKEAVINVLKNKEFGTVWVHEKGTEEVIPEEVVSQQISSQASAAIVEATEAVSKNLNIKELTFESIKGKFKEGGRFRNVIATSDVQKIINDIINKILDQQDVLVNLSTIKSQKNYLYSHAVDVTIIALMIGSKLRLSRENLEKLGVGSFLHDIGMTVLSKKMVNKRDKLSFKEYEMIKEHTKYGYEILKENSGISEDSALIALQHHERQDGFGYPNGLRGENKKPSNLIYTKEGYINSLAEIVAVADCYESMATPRPFSIAKMPEDIIKHIIVAAGTQLNSVIVNFFISMIPVYPVGSFISVYAAPQKSMIGYSGVVASIRKGYLDKPIILLINDSMGKKINPIKIDLIQYPDIKIQFVPLDKTNN